MGWAEVFPPGEEVGGAEANGAGMTPSGSTADLLLGQDLPSEDEVRAEPLDARSRAGRGMAPPGPLRLPSSALSCVPRCPYSSSGHVCGGPGG